MDPGNVLDAKSSANAPRLLPPPTPGDRPDPHLPAPAMSEPVVHWLIYSSQHRGVKIHLTDGELRFGDERTGLDEIDEVSFWSPKRHRYRVEATGASGRVSLSMRSAGMRRVDPHRQDYLEIVKLIEARAFPRMIGTRLQRLDLGLPVRIGKLELRETGLRLKKRLGTKTVSWVEFDHVLVAGRRLNIVTRGANGKRHTLGRIRLSETNAVLLPALLAIASTSFPTPAPTTAPALKKPR